MLRARWSACGSWAIWESRYGASRGRLARTARRASARFACRVIRAASGFGGRRCRSFLPPVGMEYPSVHERTRKAPYRLFQVAGDPQGDQRAQSIGVHRCSSSCLIGDKILACLPTIERAPTSALSPDEFSALLPDINHHTSILWLAYPRPNPQTLPPLHATHFSRRW